MVAAAAKSRGCVDLQPWSLRTSCDFEVNPQKSLVASDFLRPAKQKPGDFCSGMVASPACGHRGHCDFAMRCLCRQAKVNGFFDSWLCRYHGVTRSAASSLLCLNLPDFRFSDMLLASLRGSWNELEIKLAQGELLRSLHTPAGMFFQINFV